MKKMLALSMVILGLYTSGCQSQLVTEGSKAPVFTLPDLGGKKVSLDKLLKGNKQVLLNFWATWCPSCREEIPQLKELAKRYKYKVEIVGIDLKESRETVTSFIEANGVEYKILLDEDGKVANQYGIFGLPTNILISEDGLVEKTNLDIQEMESYFRQE